MPERPTSLVLTCEHASYRIPARYRMVEQRAGRVLTTHRGYDPGALELARHLAFRFNTVLFAGKWSRLLMELNRSPHHRRLFSEFSRPLAPEARATLMEGYYRPYRAAVEDHIRKQLRSGRRVLHVGVHSFTPILDGEVRRADLALLYDPARTREREFSRRWRAAMVSVFPDLVVRRNYPYRGIDDGFTTALRDRFAERNYLGIELEINQRFPLGPRAPWRHLQDGVASSLEQVLNAGLD